MRKTLEDIIPPSRRTVSDTHADIQEVKERVTKAPRRHSTKRRFAYTPSIVAVVVILLALGFLFMFSKSRIEIDPMTAGANLTGSFTANASTTSEFPYTIINAEDIASQTVKSGKVSGVKQVANGVITIYNTQKRFQKLVAKTRFKTKNGLVFRISSSVVVPAAHGVIPGAITAKVYADNPGDKYNVGASYFSVPGLIRTSLYKKVYARSKSSMSGGFVGLRAQITPEIKSSTRTRLSVAIDTDLKKAIKAQTPPGYVLLSGAATTTYSVLPNKQATTSGEVLMQERGTMTAVIFPKSALAKAVAGAISGAYSGQPVSLIGTKSLMLIPSNGLPKTTDKTFYFTLSGSTTVVWSVTPERIAAAVAGKTRDQAREVLNSFPEVKQGYIVLRPFWRNTLPEDPSQISVVVNKPEIGQQN